MHFARTRTLPTLELSLTHSIQTFCLQCVLCHSFDYPYQDITISNRLSMTKSRRGAGAGAGERCGGAKILAKPNSHRKPRSKTLRTQGNRKRQTKAKARLRRSSAPSPCERNSLFLSDLKESSGVNVATVDTNLHDPNDVEEGTILPSIEQPAISEPPVENLAESAPSHRPCRLRLYLRRPCRLRLYMKEGYHADDELSDSQSWKPSPDNGSPLEERNLQPVISTECNSIRPCCDGLSTDVFANESGYESGDGDDHGKGKWTTALPAYFEEGMQGTFASSRRHGHRAQAKYDAKGNRPPGSLLSRRDRMRPVATGKLAGGGVRVPRSLEDLLCGSDEWYSQCDTFVEFKDQAAMSPPGNKNISMCQ